MTMSFIFIKKKYWTTSKLTIMMLIKNATFGNVNAGGVREKKTAFTLVIHVVVLFTR